MYNSDLGRWFSIDPLAEKYTDLSPYVFCADNPVRFVDIDGRDIWEINWLGIMTLKKDNDPNIYVKKGRDVVLLSQFDFTGRPGRANKIINHYAREIGGGLPDAESFYTSDTKKGRPLMSIEQIVLRNLDTGEETIIKRFQVPLYRGRLNKFLDNVNNMKNSLRHERHHYENEKDFRTHRNEVELEAIKHQKAAPEYKDTTDDYKGLIERYWKHNEEELRKNKLIFKK